MSSWIRACTPFLYHILELHHEYSSETALKMDLRNQAKHRHNAEEEFSLDMQGAKYLHLNGQGV